MNNRWRKTVSRGWLLGIACVVGAWSWAIAEEPTPRADKPVAAAPGRTDRDFVREYREFDKLFVVEAYKQQGNRDPKWDEAALSLLSAESDAMGNEVSSGFTPLVTQALPLTQCVVLARQILDQQCADPMVLYVAGKILMTGGEPALAADTFKRADDLAGDSKYCALYKILMLDAAGSQRPELATYGPELEEVRQRFRPLMREALRDPKTLPAYRAVVWSKLSRFLDGTDRAMMIRIGDEMLDVPNPDEWVYECFLGNVEIQKAWRDRGSGYANTVTEEGWKGLHEHLTLAGAHLERAASLDPTLPHAHALMLSVGLGLGDDQYTRQAFEGAIARQVDFIAAYRGYMSTLTPRWGGDYAQVLDVGIKGLESGRFDTGAPAALMNAISAIETDQGSPLTRRQRERFYPLVKRMTDGYEMQSTNQEVVHWAQNVEIAQAFRLQKWTEAREALARANDLPSDNAFVADNLDPLYALGEICARTGSQAQRVNDAMKMDEPAARLSTLEAILKDVPENEKGRPWIESQVRTARLASQMQSGDWVDVPVAQGLKDWRIIRGSWSVDEEGSLIGESTNGLEIVARFEVPERADVRFQLECIKSPGAHERAFVYYSAWAPTKSARVVVNLDAANALLCLGKYRYAECRLSLEGPATRLVVRRDKFDFAVMDEDAPAASHTFSVDPTLPSRIAFGGMTVGDGSKWRVRSFQIRKLP